MKLNGLTGFNRFNQPAFKAGLQDCVITNDGDIFGPGVNFRKGQNGKINLVINGNPENGNFISAQEVGDKSIINYKDPDGYYNKLVVPVSFIGNVDIS